MNNISRHLFGGVAAVALASLLGVPASARSLEQGQPPAIVGSWTLNRDLSDQPPPRGRDGDGEDGRGRRGGGGGYGRGGFGGGFGGGMRRGRGGPGRGGMSPEDAQRMREAMRNEMVAPEQLTIVQADSMILITSQDGHTTRLSPDGKKIKEENTGIERKTKWDGTRLVSEVSGLGPGKITETYVVEPEAHRLHVTIQMSRGQSGEARTVNRVYDGG